MSDAPDPFTFLGDGSQPVLQGGGEGGTYIPSSGVDNTVGMPTNLGYYADKEANPYSDLFFYKGSVDNKVQNYTKGMSYYEIPKDTLGKNGGVTWTPSTMLGNEGQTHYTGDYKIDWNNLPKPETIYGQAMAPAFSSKEEYETFRKDPAKYTKDMYARIKKDHPWVPESWLKTLVPQYDKNYGWVLHGGTVNAIKEYEFNQRRSTKIDNFLVQTALPALASAGWGAVGAPVWAMTAAKTAQSLGSGAKPADVIKQMIISYLSGQAGQYASGAAGGGLPGWLAKQFASTGVKLIGGKLVYPTGSLSTGSSNYTGPSKVTYPTGGR